MDKAGTVEQTALPVTTAAAPALEAAVAVSVWAITFCKVTSGS